MVNFGEASMRRFRFRIEKWPERRALGQTVRTGSVPRTTYRILMVCMGHYWNEPQHDGAGSMGAD
jgi:hypothetical protein